MATTLDPTTADTTAPDTHQTLEQEKSYRPTDAMLSPEGVELDRVLNELAAAYRTTATFLAEHDDDCACDCCDPPDLDPVITQLDGLATVLRSMLQHIDSFRDFRGLMPLESLDLTTPDAGHAGQIVVAAAD